MSKATANDDMSFDIDHDAQNKSDEILKLSPQERVDPSSEETVWNAFKRELKWQSLKKALTTEIYLPFDPQRKVIKPAESIPFAPPQVIPVQEVLHTTPIISDKRFLEDLSKQIGWITPQDLKEILDQLCLRDSEAFAQRLVALELLSNDQKDHAFYKAQAENRSLWQIMITEGYLQADTFAQALIAEPGFPLIHRTHGLFSEQLITSGMITGEQMREARMRQKADGKRLDEILIEMHVVSPETVAQSLSTFLDIALVDPMPYDISMELVRIFPNIFVNVFSLLPLYIQDNVLIVVSPDPPSPLLASIIKLRLLCGVEILLCARNRYFQKLEEYNEKYLQLVNEAETVQRQFVSETQSKGAAETSRPLIENVSAIDLVGEILERAMRSRATDIHLEPQRGFLRIRLRIDGILYELMRISHTLSNEVVSRIKILADLDITEKRQSQDGHFPISVNERTYDIRVSTAPAHFGERMALRIGDSSRIIADLTALGLDPDELQKINRLSHRPYGMILSTGPTGSGKTTTLYSCLSQMDSATQNIMTIEDPVEYEIDGTSQISVNYKTNFTFVKGLRAILRHDPDTVMVGEIRDEETAIIAVRAAITGVLVFSTLHTNDSIGAVTRLINLSVPSYLVANALIGVIAQRLVRKICPNCKVETKPDWHQIEELGYQNKFDRGKRYWKGKGCEMCKNSGYLGRTGIYEILEVSEKLQDLMLESASESQLRKQAKEEGMVDLFSAGMKKIHQGITTVEEFMRVIG